MRFRFPVPGSDQVFEDVFEIDVEILPATSHQQGGRIIGLGLTLFGLFFMSSLLSLITEQVTVSPEWALPVIVAFGICMLLLGLHLLVSYKTIELNTDFVTVIERGLLGRRAWREPLTAYKGIRASKRWMVGGRRRARTRQYFCVDLAHSDPKKTVELYASSRAYDWRKKWEGYARRFGLPLLEEEEGVVIRTVEGLDKSAREMVGDGLLAVDHEILAHPPKKLATALEG